MTAIVEPLTDDRGFQQAGRAKSLLPRDQVRTVDLNVLAQALGRELDHSRGAAKPFSEVVNRFCSDHKVQLPHGLTPHWVSAGVSQIMSADEVYDSEHQRAARAAQHLLGALLGRRVLARGWFPGETVRVAGVTYTLTGNACPRCAINPEASGIGGGVRCISSACGYWCCA
ncbi:hypothetical protein ACXR2T_08010 [Leucobacter sp. HY1910]